MADKSFFVDISQRQSLRGTHQVRPSSSDLEPLHHRPITDRSSPKLGDRRSPRAQEELKNLKDQLASIEAAKKEAQQELKNKIEKPKAWETVEVNEKVSPKRTRDSKKSDCSIKDEVSEDLAEIYERAQVAAVEPINFEEVETQQGLKQAMLDEMSMIHKNQTWDLIPRQVNRKVIGEKLLRKNGNLQHGSQGGVLKLASM
ncbi:interactor of constitutive active ROPs 4-like [Gossypium arboreum]|uniref:interactor of constitutive active ROPs 4-like n=1 Tax=Gossypium arboreum TaxID=29729 RepID=UPI000819200A|nr:interactor of constitutive active ROPs 4-like [Gossypium arboreum]